MITCMLLVDSKFYLLSSKEHAEDTCPILQIHWILSSCEVTESKINAFLYINLSCPSSRLYLVTPFDVFQDPNDDNQLLSSPLASPCSVTPKKVADQGRSIDFPERTSPVSVLEPLFTEDDISPSRTISQHGKY